MADVEQKGGSSGICIYRFICHMTIHDMRALGWNKFVHTFSHRGYRPPYGLVGGLSRA